MALTWKLDKIEKSHDLWETLTEEQIQMPMIPFEVRRNFGVGENDTVKRLSWVTVTLILRTMNIGMNEITQKNRDEFAQRLYIYERIAGASLHNPDWTPRPLTWADVNRHVGLVTNASTMSRRQFEKHMIDIVDVETRREITRHEEPKRVLVDVRDIEQHWIAEKPSDVPREVVGTWTCINGHENTEHRIVEGDEREIVNITETLAAADDLRCKTCDSSERDGAMTFSSPHPGVAAVLRLEDEREYYGG